MAGRVAIVTGGGQGLGRAIALRLARDGARVAIAQRSPEPLEHTVREIEAAGGTALSVPTDLREPAQIAALAATVREQLGPIDILVNNAGFNQRRPTFAEIDFASWSEVLAGNLTAPFLLAQAALPDMLARGWGRIVNVGAVQAWMPMEGTPPTPPPRPAWSG